MTKAQRRARETVAAPRGDGTPRPAALVPREGRRLGRDWRCPSASATPHQGSMRHLAFRSCHFGGQGRGLGCPEWLALRPLDSGRFPRWHLGTSFETQWILLTACPRGPVLSDRSVPRHLSVPSLTSTLTLPVVPISQVKPGPKVFLGVQSAWNKWL